MINEYNIADFLHIKTIFSQKAQQYLCKTLNYIDLCLIKKSILFVKRQNLVEKICNVYV